MVGKVGGLQQHLVVRNSYSWAPTGCWPCYWPAARLESVQTPAHKQSVLLILRSPHKRWRNMRGGEQVVNSRLVCTLVWRLYGCSCSSVSPLRPYIGKGRTLTRGGT